MNTLVIIQSILGLLAILIIIGFILFYNPNKKKKVVKKKKKVKKVKVTKDFLYLKSIIKNRETSTKELKETLNKVINEYGKIPPKNGRSLTTNDDFLQYMEIIFALTTHPNITKEIILDFDKRLGQKNPEYSKDISNAIMKGLSARRS
jgi:hypothetical protein